MGSLADVCETYRTTPLFSRPFHCFSLPPCVLRCPPPQQAAGTLQAYNLQVRTRLYASAGAETTLLWSYHRCSLSQYAQLSGYDTVACLPCPAGGDCASGTTSAASDLGVAAVTQASIVAQRGWWAPEDSDGLQFYPCPMIGSCLSGGNGSRAQCATGYSGIACSVCADGYFEQFGRCALCPQSHGASLGALLGIGLMLVAFAGFVFVIRKVLPVDVLKLGLSMLQVATEGLKPAGGVVMPWSLCVAVCVFVFEFVLCLCLCMLLCVCVHAFVFVFVFMLACVRICTSSRACVADVSYASCAPTE